jgi:hypothetical protein
MSLGKEKIETYHYVLIRVIRDGSASRKLGWEAISRLPTVHTWFRMSHTHNPGYIVVQFSLYSDHLRHQYQIRLTFARFCGSSSHPGYCRD